MSPFPATVATVAAAVLVARKEGLLPAFQCRLESVAGDGENR
jgi:hypothetical protein